LNSSAIIGKRRQEKMLFPICRLTVLVELGGGYINVLPN